MTTVTIPHFAGTRWAAGQLAADTVFDDDEVTLDFTGCASAGQGFCDELVSQITDDRGLSIVSVIGASKQAEEYLALAVHLRGLSPIPDVGTQS